MPVIFELWDTESANLIDSYSSMPEAWESAKNAIESGSFDWVEHAILIIKMDSGDKPILLWRGPDMLTAIRRANDSRRMDRPRNNTIEMSGVTTGHSVRFGGASSRAGFTYPPNQTDTLIATGD